MLRYVHWVKETPTEHTKFTLFPQLPTECRDKIWEFSLPAPRIVYPRWKEVHFDRTNPTAGHACLPVYLGPKYNAQLGRSIRSTCRDSRSVLQLYYHALKQVQNIEPPRSLHKDEFTAQIKREGPVWIDGRRDTLVLETALLEVLDRKSLKIDVSRIRNIALETLASDFSSLRPTERLSPYLYPNTANPKETIWHRFQQVAPDLKTFSLMCIDDSVHDSRKDNGNPFSGRKGEMVLLDMEDQGLRDCRRHLRARKDHPKLITSRKPKNFPGLKHREPIWLI